MLRLLPCAFAVAALLVPAAPATAAPAPGWAKAKPGAKAKRAGKGPRAYGWRAAPRPPAPPADPCANPGRGAAIMQLDRASAAREERFSITLRNVGERCLSFGAEYHYERWNGAAWERVPVDYPVPSWGAGIAPGESFTFGGWVYPELEPGRHRVVKVFEPGVVATAEIEVT